MKHILRGAGLGLALLLASAFPALATNCSSFTYTLTNGQTADATQVMSNFNNLLTCANNNLAHNGTNSDITSMTGLTTPLPPSEGGTGVASPTLNTLLVGNGSASMTQTAVGVMLRSYIAGLTLSNDGVTPNSVLDVAAGSAVDSTQAQMLSIGAFTKSTAGSWVAGTGANGMGTGLTIANSTWYHVFLILNGGVADIYFDTSATAANAPVGTTFFRRIGSFKTDGFAHIINFIQDGDYFRWKTVLVLDVNATNPGTSAVTATLADVPPGVNVQAMMNAGLTLGGASVGLFYASDLAATDQVPSNTGAPMSQINGVVSATVEAPIQIRTNTSQQIRYRLSFSDVNTIVNIAVLGWWDRRGRDS